MNTPVKGAPRRRLVFESFEPRILLSADLWGIELPVNGAPDEFALRLNAGSGELELLSGGSVVDARPLDMTSGVVINGEDGHDDSLTIDFGGGVFALADGVTYNGGAGGYDFLAVTGGAFTAVTHTVTGSQSGTIAYEGAGGSALILYTGLEPVDMTGSTITDLVFNLPGVNDQAILEDDGAPGNGISQLRSQNGTFETTLFSSTVASLTVNMGADSGALTIASLPDFSGALTVNGQAGADSVTFTGTAGFSTIAASVGGPVTDVVGSNLQVAGNARFSGSMVVLGDIPGEVVNFGTLSATATGPMTVFESSDMVLAGTSTASVASLRSAGSITGEPDAIVRAFNSTLNAQTSIGAPGAGALNVDLGNVVAITGSGGIFLNDLDTSGDGLRLFEVTAAGGTGAIEISTAGNSITDVNFAPLFGSSIVLSAGRNIGTATNPLDINTGSLTATSGTFGDVGDVYVVQQGGQALRLNLISANEGAGAIDILTGAPNANLLDGNGDAVNLRGGNVNLTSGRHIGFDETTVDALETEVTTLSARGALGVPVTAGDIHINEIGGSLALGLVDAEAGNISIAAAGSITDANDAELNLSAATVTLSAGGHIGFNGLAVDALETTALVVSSIHAGGMVALESAGTLTLAGAVDVGKNDVVLTAPSVVLASAAVLNVDLGGVAAGQFTRYLVSGALSLDGTLDADLVDGFVPVSGDRFRVMDFASSTGAFAATDLPTNFFVEAHAEDVELVFAGNEPPVFVEVADQTVVEGGELRFTLEATDPDLPPQTLTFSVGALPAGASFDPATREFVWLPVDDASATVTFTVTDSEGASDVMEVVLTATNAAPTVDAGPDQVVGLQKDHDHGHGHHKDRKEAEVSIAAAFGDLGAADTHTATIDWGDGTVTAGAVGEPAGGTAGTVSGEHTYTKAGTYTVTVTVTDDDGGTRSDTLLVTVKKPVEKKNFDAKNDSYRLKEDTVLRVDAPHGVLANDRTPGSAPVEARVIEGPKHGTLTFNADGSFVYVPDADFHGKDSFRYEFTDGVNVTKAAEVKLVVQNVPEKKAHRPCVDWHDHWHAGLGRGHDFLPFGHHAWKRFF